MKTVAALLTIAIACLLEPGSPARADSPDADRFQLMDVFHLEFASDPQVSADGKRVA